MNNVYKTLNSIQTHLLIWDDPFNCNGQDVIVCITGNPGYPGFYTEFGTELHKSTGLPVCVIGHAGHEEVPDENSNILKNQECLFNLQGQLNHKVDLICNHIDKKSKLHLIGHSVGCWLIVELIHKNNDLINRISSINLLFPTLQRIGQTRNGKHVVNIVKKMHKLIILIITFLYILPETVRIFLINLYLRFNSLPSLYNKRILNYMKPKVWEKFLFLAYDEMDNITELNTEAVNKVKHLTNVIYTKTDGWAPLHYIEDLKKFEPELHMKEVNCEHAFVLKSSEYIAELVSDVITSKKLK